MPIPPHKLDHYRQLARKQGVPESCIDATVRWIFNAAASAIDIAWGDHPVQQVLGKTKQNAVGTLAEHGMISPQLMKDENGEFVPSGAGKDDNDDKR